MKIGILTSLLALGVLTGCAAPSRLTKLEDVQSTEVAVIAKIALWNNGTPKSIDNIVLADSAGTGVKVIGQIDQFQPDAQGYIYAKLQVGKRYFLQSLIYNNGFAQKNFLPNVVVFDVRPGGPQYLGDVFVDWTGLSTAASTAISVVGGPIGTAFASIQGDYKAVVVEDNAAAQVAFNRKFQTNIPLTLNLAISATPR